MADVVAVLLVPAEGDPSGLLAEGRCGWAPALAWIDHQSDGWHWRVGNTRNGYALPLWWDGALVPEGWDRARRRAGCSPTPAPTVEAVAGFAESLVRDGLAARVVRLTRDASGALVEAP